MYTYTYIGCWRRSGEMPGPVAMGAVRVATAPMSPGRLTATIPPGDVIDDDVSLWPNFPVRISTWNCAALFASSLGATRKPAMRWARVRSLAQLADIICLQEVHGHAGDLASLDGELPEFKHGGSFCASPASGGVTVSIRKSLTDRCGAIETSVLADGRCLCVRLQGVDFAISVISAHVDPAMTTERKKAFLREILDLFVGSRGLFLLCRGLELHRER